MNLPIELVPNTSPPVFRWRQLVETLGGKQVIEHQEAVSPTMEVALVRLISAANQLAMENAALRGQVDGLVERSEARSAQSQSQSPAPASISSRKGRG